MIAARSLSLSLPLRRATTLAARPRTSARAVGARRGYDGLRRLCRRYADGAIDRGDQTTDAVVAGDQPLDPAAIVHDLGHQLREQHFVDPPGDDGQRLAQRRVDTGACPRQHLGLGELQHLGAVALGHHLEMRRYRGLQRKTLQHRLAEPMDRHDLHAARRIEHPGEQLPRQGQIGGRRRPVNERRNRHSQHVVGERRPGTEPGVDADAHLRRRRLRERQAQDAHRRRTGEQQCQHAVGQHLGLAAAGRGADPDAVGRPHGPLLTRLGDTQDLAAGAHHGSSRPVDHSLTRARCS